MATLFVIVLTYVRPLEEIDAARADHIAWLQRGYDDGTFLASGPRIPRNGGIILAKGESLEKVAARLTHDPFHERGLATAEIFPFEANMLSNAMRVVV